MVGAAGWPVGGFAFVAGVGVTALLLRDFWSYDARTDPHAVAEREARRRAGEDDRAAAQPHQCRVTMFHIPIKACGVPFSSLGQKHSSTYFPGGGQASGSTVSATASKTSQ